MKRSLNLRLALGILSISWQTCARPATAPGQSVTIHLYDLANLSPHMLDEAAREAARVLATASVEITWQQGLANSPEAHATDQSAKNASSQQSFAAWDYLVVRIVRGAASHALPGALGYALPDAKNGAHATVFYDRIEPLAHAGVISLSALLGHAMAHEIGHVLLGTTEHSPDGIMKARWGKADFQRGAMGFLGFTASQRASIQARLASRLARN